MASGNLISSIPLTKSPLRKVNLYQCYQNGMEPCIFVQFMKYMIITSLTNAILTAVVNFEFTEFRKNSHTV